MSFLFSLVTPSYNQGTFIKATIDSILGQDYPHLELFVMDGASKDHTVDVLKSIDDPRMQWVSEPDSGQCEAINKGLRQTQGEIVAYLNSDDVFFPGMLSFVADYFAKHPDVAVIYGDCQMIDAQGKMLPQVMDGQPFDLRLLMTTRLDIPQPTVFWRREVMDKIGLFDESLQWTMDYDYWIRMAAGGFRPVYVPGYRAGFRLHGESKTSTAQVGQWSDWELIFDKIYALPDLPPEIAAYKRESYAYFHLAGAELMFALDKKAEARPHLRYMLANGTLRSRVLGAAMYLDSALNTDLAHILRAIYSRTLRTG